MRTLTVRNGKVIEFGDSLGITLRQEILDMKMDAGSPVRISLEESQEGKRIIVIESLEK
jgi:hypothetical protein